MNRKQKFSLRAAAGGATWANDMTGATLSTIVPELTSLALGLVGMGLILRRRA